MAEAEYGFDLHFILKQSAMVASGGSICTPRRVLVQLAASTWVPNRGLNSCTSKSWLDWSLHHCLWYDLRSPDPALKELSEKYLPDYRAKEEAEGTSAAESGMFVLELCLAYGVLLSVCL